MFEQAASTIDVDHPEINRCAGAGGRLGRRLAEKLQAQIGLMEVLDEGDHALDENAKADRRDGVQKLTGAPELVDDDKK